MKLWMLIYGSGGKGSELVGIIYAFIYIGAAWRWGDWRSWEKYYPTILFYIVGDLLYEFLLYDNFPLWKFQAFGLDQAMELTHTEIIIPILLVKYPCTILIFLGNFPYRQTARKFCYIAFWVGLYTINELIDMQFNALSHHNGWSVLWSILFNFVMFSMFALHHKRPLYAWASSFVFILFLWNVFDVPSKVFR